MSPILSLSNEIWFIIISYIPLHKLKELKFLYRRFRTIVTLSPLHDKLEHYQRISYETFDVDTLYKTVTDLYNNFLRELEYYFNFPTMCYLIYRLQSVRDEILPSNVLFHFFNCPRSEFLSSKCGYCSYLLISIALNISVIFNLRSNCIIEI